MSSSRSATTSWRRIITLRRVLGALAPGGGAGACTCRRSHATRSRRWPARRPTSCTPSRAATRSSSPKPSPPAVSCRRRRYATRCSPVRAARSRCPDDARARRGRAGCSRAVARARGRRGGWARRCEERGLLAVEGGVVRYRHELARRVIEGSLSGGRRAELHARVLDALLPLGRRPGATRPPRGRGRRPGEDGRVLACAPPAPPRSLAPTPRPPRTTRASSTSPSSSTGTSAPTCSRPSPSRAITPGAPILRSQPARGRRPATRCGRCDRWRRRPARALTAALVGERRRDGGGAGG